MEKYKIKVNSEAESKEVQELFFELGYEWSGCGVTYLSIGGFTFITAYPDAMRLAMGWGGDTEIELNITQLRDMVSSHRKPTEQHLISGADALRALANGKEVEYLYGDKWLSVVGEQVLITAVTDDKFKFRLKPSTIKLELDIPAPFEPKEKDIFWTLSTNYKCGYVQILCYRNDEQGEILAQFGAWRTEEQVKQVVAALRGGIKG